MDNSSFAKRLRNLAQKMNGAQLQAKWDRLAIKKIEQMHNDDVKALIKQLKDQHYCMWLLTIAIALLALIELLKIL